METIDAVQAAPSNNIAQLYAALAKAQGAFQPIEKNRTVTIAIKDKQTGQTRGSYEFRYADLEQILSKTRPALSAHGLALIQTINDGRLICSLLHAGGGVITSEMPVPAVRDMGDPKAFGAAITYLRRYLVTAMLGVAADDDLDEDGQDAEMDHQVVPRATKPAVATPQRKAAAAPAPAQALETSELATPGEIAYIHKKLDGRADGPEIIEAHQLPYDLAGMTKAQFASIKAALL